MIMIKCLGENLTIRLRREVFEAMLSQEMGWFDRKENSTGALWGKLSGNFTERVGLLDRKENRTGALCAKLSGSHFELF